MEKISEQMAVDTILKNITVDMQMLTNAVVDRRFVVNQMAQQKYMNTLFHSNTKISRKG